MPGNRATAPDRCARWWEPRRLQAPRRPGRPLRKAWLAAPLREVLPCPLNTLNGHDTQPVNGGFRAPGHRAVSLFSAPCSGSARRPRSRGAGKALPHGRRTVRMAYPHPPSAREPKLCIAGNSVQTDLSSSGKPMLREQYPELLIPAGSSFRRSSPPVHPAPYFLDIGTTFVRFGRPVKSGIVCSALAPRRI